MSDYVWMAVSRDGLELPIAVADTTRELARMVGVHEETIRTEVSRFKSGKSLKKKHQHFFKVYLEEEDEVNDV